MKIIILVLIFSLSYKLNCEKSENPPETQDDGLEDELKIDETEKVDAVLQEDPADKMDAEVEEDSTEKINSRFYRYPGYKLEGVVGPLDDVDDSAQKLEGVVQNDSAHKNVEKDQTCEGCGVDKLNDLKGEDADREKQINKDLVEVFDNKVQSIMALFPSGDVADLFGNNQHYKIPDNYQDFGRRFVLQYPYTETKSADEEAEDDLHNTVQQFIQNKQDSQDPLPVKAPPEFVLDIAKKSVFLEASKPKNPTDDIINKDILRSGNYWNDVRKEEIDPKKMLRSSQSKNNLVSESVKVEIKPGSKLFNLISKLKGKSPRLLYVINKDID